VATCFTELMCRMRGGLVLHTIVIPAALSLPLLRGAAVGRAPTIFQNDWFCTRISNFFQSPIFSTARVSKDFFETDFSVRIMTSWKHLLDLGPY